MLKKWFVIFALVFSIGSTTLLIASSENQEETEVSRVVSDENSTACSENLTACTNDLAECNKSLAALKDPKTGIIVQCDANKAEALAAQEKELTAQFEANKTEALAAQEKELTAQFEANKTEALAAQEKELEKQYEADKAAALAAQEEELRAQYETDKNASLAALAAELEANCTNEKAALKTELENQFTKNITAIQTNLEKCQSNLEPRCDKDYCDNACTNLNKDPNNCGKCGIVCDTLPHTKSTYCYNGICRVEECEVGWGNCDRDARNGCEAQLNTDKNCHECGNECATNQSCVNGYCMSKK
jgi:hypothetical protein